MTDLLERTRRRPGASGTPIRLADGREWLLAIPTVRGDGRSLSNPGIDPAWGRIYESMILDQGASLGDVWSVARELLRANYHLDDAELGELLSIAPGDAAREFVETVISILFGDSSPTRSYVDWVRASLNANGLSASEISLRDLPDVLAILVATNRTIPPDRFIDANLAAHERAALDGLI